MATPMQVYPTYTTFATDRGRLWRATPHGQRAVVMRTGTTPVRGAGRPALSRGRYRHVIALVVPADAVSLDIAVVRQVFDPRAVAESDVAGQYEVLLCGEQSNTDGDELAPLETMVTADTVIVPGVENPLAPRSTALIDALRGAYATGARMVGFGSGVFLLGYAGVLDGRRATTHWKYAREFRDRFPSVRVDTEISYVDDDRVHTGGGVLSGVDLALHLLAMDVGQARAEAVGRAVIAAPWRGDARARRDDREPMAPVMAWLREHLHEPLSLAKVAEQSYISERSLVRKFRAATGTTIFDWVNRERIDRAKLLLETTDHPVAEIAAMVGFGSPETLRRNFQRHVGTTARSYRHKFRHAAARAERD
ncbi:GlxA family transcriptional regulator [Kutzneria kofuensis]|uniref:Transcriptional regulator GlxA family with amidase domain n=1 Tax=Kutzneria kofuensis TaxID=103725 RepID=A0A7W9NLV8_9PSEU|nr:helix-turn-helix domain-containing protein [Kutzneria kofuensis]MBB5897470.1 transcriptional regulator GlxA family with amidase domain [Kutzneria kofuensis]